MEGKGMEGEEESKVWKGNGGNRGDGRELNGMGEDKIQESIEKIS